MAEPRPKKHCKLKPPPPFPSIQTKLNGAFNGFNVIIEDDTEMKNVIAMGYYGKANLSRSFPSFKKSEFIRKRVFNGRKKWAKPDNAPRKVIVLPDSDSEDYFTDLRPVYELDRSEIRESVHLALEEAFFLMGPIGCLNIYHKAKILEVEEAWELFKHADKCFVQNYVVYYHFRSKNWVVKPGIKFGGDFLLYKQGPPFYHASYLVIIDVVNESGERQQDFCRRSMEMVKLGSLNRLCETAAKELLICEVMYPKGTFTHNDLDQFQIKEVVMKRWLPSSQPTLLRN